MTLIDVIEPMTTMARRIEQQQQQRNLQQEKDE
jgi:hypothetical protein